MNHATKYWPMVLAAAIAACVCLFGPVRSDEKRVTSDEKKLAWDGEINPYELPKWDVVPGSDISAGLNMLRVIVQNPDKKAEIQRVKVFYEISSTIIVGYQYFKGGIPYVYRLRCSEKKYVRLMLAEENLGACMECHRDKFTKTGV